MNRQHWFTPLNEKLLWIFGSVISFRALHVHTLSTQKKMCIIEIEAEKHPENNKRKGIQKAKINKRKRVPPPTRKRKKCRKREKQTYRIRRIKSKHAYGGIYIG